MCVCLTEQRRDNEYLRNSSFSVWMTNYLRRCHFLYEYVSFIGTKLHRIRYVVSVASDIPVIKMIKCVKQKTESIRR